ncbi:MAG: hypothetical protein IJ307_00795 [Bacteroidales bacterium]|nr:hypothetical protein [Bacteroidales bacterium]
MEITTLYIFLLATGASFVQRTTGFGFGIFIMTLLPFMQRLFTADVGKGYAIGLGGLALGLLLGEWTFKRIPGRIFPYLVYTYICISGIIIFITAL